MPEPMRAAGRPWRLLAHTPTGPVDIRSDQHPDAEFDELVVAGWIHLEQMDKRAWWMNIGGVTVWVRTTKKGRPKSVTVYGPNDYAGGPEPGCTYDCVWTASPDGDPIGAQHGRRARDTDGDQPGPSRGGQPGQQAPETPCP